MLNSNCQVVLAENVVAIVDITMNFFITKERSMNSNELKYFSEHELFSLPDATALPFTYLFKCMLVKIRRKLWGRFADKNTRFVWTINTVSDVDGPAANVRNYIERQTIRSLLRDIKGQDLLRSACEIGCGYGRLTMVLKEFAKNVSGFEREKHLVDLAQRLLPDIKFYQVDGINNIDPNKVGFFDLVMVCAVLQHLTDEYCRSVISTMKKLTPDGYILIIEKTEAISVTENVTKGNEFISRARPVELYEEWMKPYALIKKKERVLENTYFNKHPGTCMLFKAP